MAKPFLCFFAVVSFIQCASALPPYEYADFATKDQSNTNFFWVPDRPLKFQSFYPQWDEVLREASTGPCLLSLQAYEGNLTARSELTKSGGVGNYCYLQNDCILSSIYQSTLSNFAAATVLLGLTPSILAQFGPEVAEIALLSSQRPLLSLLLSMGAPAAFPTRFLKFDNPINRLHPERPSTLKISRMPLRIANAISLFQYAFAILAITNMIVTSLELGRKTVVSWRCSVSWIPLMWALTPIVCHAPAVLSFEVYRRKVKTQKRNKTTNDIPLIQQTTKNIDAESVKSRSSGSHLRRAIRSEFTISANANAIPIAQESKEVDPGAWSIILQSVASLFGILQLIFGTAVFSSLLYIGVEDATILLLRYASSAFSCRLIMYIELEGMTKVVRDEEKRSREDEKITG